MKIESSTPHELVLVRRSWFILILIPVLVVAGIVALTLGINRGSSYLVVGGVLLTVCLLFAVLYRTVRIACDSRKQALTISKYGLFGNHTDRDLTFAEISEIQLKELISYSRTSAGNQERKFKYFLVFVLQNGHLEQYEVTPSIQHSWGDLSDQYFKKHNHLIDLTRTLAEFIGVPFRDQMSPTISDGFDLVNKLIDMHNKKS